MKIAAVVLGVLFSGYAMASSPAVDCFKTTLTDADILSATKAQYGYPASNAPYIEGLALNFCKGASTSSAPGECFKAVLKDGSVLSATKAQYGYPASNAPYIEGLALKFCGATESHQ